MTPEVEADTDKQEFDTPPKGPNPDRSPDVGMPDVQNVPLGANEHNLGECEGVTLILTSDSQLSLYSPGVGKVKFCPKEGTADFGHTLFINFFSTEGSGGTPRISRPPASPIYGF